MSWPEIVCHTVGSCVLRGLFLKGGRDRGCKGREGGRKERREDERERERVSEPERGEGGSKQEREGGERD